MNVLVVDDEPSICWGFQQLLGQEGFHVLVAGSAEAGLELARKNSINLVLLDVRLPGICGLEALKSFRQTTSDAPVIVMTAFGDLETAVKAVEQGATDYLNKPFCLDDALSVCQRALRRSTSSVSAISGEPMEFGRRSAANGSSSNSESGASSKSKASALIGKSAAMQSVFHQIALVADSDLSVLIVGETGTGKELVAEAIHRHSRRRDKAYVPAAPVTFNPSLLESELFGHVRGAFTGASEDRPGLFEAAQGGTILLDEIGDLPMGSQVKLLRVLEQRRFSRVGEIQSRPCDVRILAATHRDLQKGVADGTFREDLLYRLSGITLELPALRQRLDDIGPLIEHFLTLIGYPRANEAVDADLLAQLQSRTWPGNIRELRNAVERAAVIARGRKLDINDFAPNSISSSQSGSHQETAAKAIELWAQQQISAQLAQSGPQPGEMPLYERFLSVTEPALFRAVLESVGGNRSAAADALGLHRATLRERLKRYGIE
ncbi:MAG: sigma-54 dependent transcriptional regulator [Pirellulales bacterium]